MPRETEETVRAQGVPEAHGYCILLGTSVSAYVDWHVLSSQLLYEVSTAHGPISQMRKRRLGDMR